MASTDAVVVTLPSPVTITESTPALSPPSAPADDAANTGPPPAPLPKPPATLPNNADWQQQRLPAWQPTLSPRTVVWSYAALTIFFIPIGAALIYASNTAHINSVRYDQLAPVNQNATFLLNITSTMTAPFYFYYQLTNYYQNHRRYELSKSDDQLAGESSYSTSYCAPSPFDSNDQGETYYPCGIIPASVFNDTFTASLCRGCDTSNCKLMGSPSSQPDDAQWNKAEIVYPTDKSEKYVDNSNQYPFSKDNTTTRVGLYGILLPEPNNEDFIVWARVGALPTFKKLYRVIHILPDGDDQVNSGDCIQVTTNNLFPTTAWSGHKVVRFETTSALGGRNQFLGWAWIATGIACFLAAIVFALSTLQSPPEATDLAVFKRQYTLQRLNSTVSQRASLRRQSSGPGPLAKGSSQPHIN